MKSITEFIEKQKNLIPLSAWITLGVLILVFILAQIFSFTGMLTKDDPLHQQMEIRELVKLRFDTKPVEKPPKKVKFKTKKNRTGFERVQRKSHPKRQEAKARPNIASLVQGLNFKKLISNQSAAAKRGSSNNKMKSASISTNKSNRLSAISTIDLSSQISKQGFSGPATRKSAGSGGHGSKVGIGSGHHVGAGTGVGGVALAGLGTGTGRATRGTGTHSGGAKITLPSAAGGDDAAIDIHALIKWMKAHPGTIPKLVAYDMGHNKEDLSSAVRFKLNGKSYRLFLSCNEVELLLRICLVDGSDFTLLKDAGIQEESNYLTIGDVVRQNARIKSLISSRRAPGDRAARFYQIFWSWWLKEQG